MSLDNDLTAGERACAQAHSRIAIEGVSPRVDGGRFPAKVVAGQPFSISVDIFADGHDILGAALEVHAKDDVETKALLPLGNDRWGAELTMPMPGLWHVIIFGWRDLFATWHADTTKKRDAGQDIALELIEGRQLIKDALAHRLDPGNHSAALADLLTLTAAEPRQAQALLLSDETLTLLRIAGPRSNPTRHPPAHPRRSRTGRTMH